MSSETDRLAELASFRIINGPENPVLNAATRLAAQMFDCPIASVTLIDDDTQWLVGRTGLDVCTTTRDESFCTLAIELPARDIMVVENAALDPRFENNPLVFGDMGIRFYAGALLTTSNGYNLGSLCVIDTVPRARPSQADLARLRDLADLAVAELERVRSERRREDQQKLLNMAEAMSGVGHWRVDLGTGKCFWSDEVYEIYGLERARFDPSYGSSLPFYHEADQKVLTAAIDQAIADRAPFDLELGFRRADGVDRRVVAKGVCGYDGQGQPLDLIGVFQDVTEQREAVAAAEQAAAIKSEFLANMSHELRTPLTSIIGFTELAADQPGLPPLAGDYIRRVDNAGRALLCLVNDILDFSKLEAGQVAVRPQPTDIAALCRSTLELFTPQAGAKDLALDLDVAADGPLMVDPDRVRQILLNLVSNAVKFTSQGSVRVEAAWNARTERLRVTVQDTGAGIAPDKLRLLFQRFSQVDGSASRSHGGTGLGLAICKGLSEAMGGAVGADSAPGVGSRFWFEIAAPAAPVAVPAHDLHVRVAAPVPPVQDLTGFSVLVADDHPANRELARLYLAGCGAEVVLAEDGAEALAMAVAQAFDLVLMDVRMPVMDGLEALAAIRSTPGASRGAPILAYTADAGDPEGDYRLTEAGFAGVVSKPIDAHALIAMVARVLSRDERRALRA